MSGKAQYLLDTDVLWETRRPQPQPEVLSFLRAAGQANLFLSVLVLGELRKGVANKGRTDLVTAAALGAWVDGLEATFAKRIVDIDAAASRLWGDWSAHRTRPVMDTLLAATATANGITIATRNACDVSDLPEICANPWLQS